MYWSAFAMPRAKLAIYSDKPFASTGKKSGRGEVKKQLQYQIIAKINRTITALPSDLKFI